MKKKPLNEFAKEAMEKAWAEAMLPGEHHERLERMAGSWTYTGKVWMDPGAPPTETSGTSEQKMILGGRFLQLDVKGTHVGQVFEGIGFAGYNNLAKEYQSVWMDNMGTMIVTMTGECDASGKILTSHGEYKNPMTGGMTKFRSVSTMKSEDKFVDEWFEIKQDGKEVKTMELIYTRK